MNHAFIENYRKYMSLFHETLFNRHLRKTDSVFGSVGLCFIVISLETITQNNEQAYALGYP